MGVPEWWIVGSFGSTEKPGCQSGGGLGVIMAIEGWRCEEKDGQWCQNSGYFRLAKAREE